MTKLSLNREYNIEGCYPTSKASKIKGVSDQRKEARLNYNKFNTEFEQLHLYKKMQDLLQHQIYMLFKWCVIYYICLNPNNKKLIDPGIFNLTPKNFKPDNNVIEEFKVNPQFMWRFSDNNYKCIKKILSGDINTTVNLNDLGLTTWFRDNSKMVPYITDKSSKLKNRIRKILKKSIKHHVGRHKFHKIDKIDKDQFYHFTNYENDVMYSADFYLHEMYEVYSYYDFLVMLITGSFERKPGKLIKEKCSAINHHKSCNELSSLVLFQDSNINVTKGRYLSILNQRKNEMEGSGRTSQFYFYPSCGIKGEIPIKTSTKGLNFENFELPTFHRRNF